MTRFIADIIVIGAGPAGLCIACDLADLGCSVALVTPDDQLSWNNTFGVWSDDLRQSPLADCIAREWSTSHVVLPDGVRDLGRGYALIDNDAAAQSFTTLCAQKAVQTIVGTVVGVDHDDVGSTVTLHSGERLRTVLVIDATGVGKFTTYQGPAPSLWQVAVGRKLVGEHPYPSDAMRLMDFSSEGLFDEQEAPSFLYAMPLEDGVFVEETYLIAPPGGELAELERRLDARLQRDGVKAIPTGEVEHVRIPMNTALPKANQRIVPFGAAAAMIHPATGYSVGRSLHASRPLAQAIATAMDASRDPASVARIAHRALWSDDARLVHDLLTYGGEFISGLNTQQTRTFFQSFFSTPQQTWVDYMRGDLSAGQLASVMLTVFRSSPQSMRMRMMWSGARPTTVVSALRSLTRTRRSA